ARGGAALVRELTQVLTDGGWSQVGLPAADPAELVDVDVVGVGDRVGGLVLPGGGGPPTVEERGFRALVESAADVIHVLEPSGVTRYISPGAADVLGYSPQELVAKHFREMIDPRDQAAVEAAFA